ncbi:MAG: transcriptional regulator [Rhodospirillales bacterium]|nr:transcriptional regulator [Rhodospirillales bacterium]
MTPFGARLRALRGERGLTLTRMAADLGLSAAYLSALEHGKRARPTPGLVRQICGYLGIIWDDADELQALARRSRPKVTVETGGLSPLATELANLLADRIGDLDEPTLVRLLDIARNSAAPSRRRLG